MVRLNQKMILREKRGVRGKKAIGVLLGLIDSSFCVLKRRREVERSFWSKFSVS